MTDVPPPGGYPQQPQQPGGYEPPPQQPAYQPPPAAPPQPGYQQPPPGYPQQPGQFQPVNPQPSNSGNGCLKAFLIGMVVVIILGVISTVAFIAFVGKAVDEATKTFGVADAADYDIPAGDIKCSVDDFGSMKASGTITNKKSSRQAYQVKVDFSDADNVKLGTSTALTGALNSGQKGSWNVTDFDSTAVGKSITCKVAEVDYWLT